MNQDQLNDLAVILHMAMHYHDSPSTKAHFCIDWSECDCNNAKSIRNMNDFVWEHWETI